MLYFHTILRFITKHQSILKIWTTPTDNVAILETPEHKAVMWVVPETGIWAVNKVQKTREDRALCSPKKHDV